MDEKGPDTAVARLMPTLVNKLATVSSGAGEQCIEGCNPDAVSLIQALSLQVITWSAARQAASKSYVSINSSVSGQAASKPCAEAPVVNESPSSISPAPLLKEVSIPFPTPALVEDIYYPKEPTGCIRSNISLLELIKKA